MSSRTRTITPDEIEQERYPFRRAWPSIIVETAILAGVCVGVYFITRLLNIQLSGLPLSIVEAALIAVPVILWIVFSLMREQAADLPRFRLLIVMIITLLAANAVTIPAADALFQTSDWLPHEATIQRILGYTFTLGVAQAITQYLVVYYCVYPRGLRVRADSIAYFAAASVGYAAMLNIHFMLNSAPALDVLALTVFANQATSLAMSFMLAFGLAEVRFASPTPFLMMIMLALSALIFGASVTLRGGLVNGGFSLLGSEASPLYGFAFSTILLVAVGVVIAFFFRTAERREEEAALAQAP